MDDALGRFMEFPARMKEPLLRAARDHPFTIYGVDEGSEYGDVLHHMLKVYERVDALYVEVTTNGTDLGPWSLKKPERQIYIHDRHQVLCVSSAQNIEVPYRVGRRIREIEADDDIHSQGMSIAAGARQAEHFSHFPFSEITRHRLVDGMRRPPVAEERVVYGNDSTDYIDRIYNTLLQDARMQTAVSNGGRVLVVERQDFEYAAQYLVHRLFEDDGKRVDIMWPEKTLITPDIELVVIPGSPDPEIVEAYSDLLPDKDVLWLDDL